MTTVKGVVCAETNRLIDKGNTVAYYPDTKKYYANNSVQAGELRDLHFAASMAMADADY
jgi:hypothetical protein